MEELWKDMSLCSTPVARQSYHHLHTPAAAPYRGAAYHQDYLAGAVPQPPRTPPPHTALTLEFTCLGGAGAGNSASSDDPVGYHFGFSASGGGSIRRAAAQPSVGGDRRQRRMMKNRESAARSRARKQAHNNEMELELAQLRRENRMLIQREQDLINDRLARAQQVTVPNCSSSSGSSRRSTLQPKQQQQQRCRSAPAPGIHDRRLWTVAAASSFIPLTMN